MWSELVRRQKRQYFLFKQTTDEKKVKGCNLWGFGEGGCVWWSLNSVEQEEKGGEEFGKFESYRHKKRYLTQSSTVLY